MSYHGAVHAANPKEPFGSLLELVRMVRVAPEEVVITKTNPRQYSGPLPLATDPLSVGGPNPADPSWIVILSRLPDGSWRAVL